MPDSFFGSFDSAICFIASTLTVPVEAGGDPADIWNKSCRKKIERSGDEES